MQEAHGGAFTGDSLDWATLNQPAWLQLRERQTSTPQFPLLAIRRTNPLGPRQGEVANVCKEKGRAGVGF